MEWIVLVLILGVISGSILLVKKRSTPMDLGSWASLANILGALFTGISLLWGAYTYYDQSKLQREVAANNIYEESMKLSIEHPEFANSSLAPKPVGKDTCAEHIKEYERYRWYVGQSMYSFELILDALPKDISWKKTAGQFIKDHHDYIRDSLPCDRYSPAIQRIIEDSLGKINCLCKIQK